MTSPRRALIAAVCSSALLMTACSDSDSSGEDQDTAASQPAGGEPTGEESPSESEPTGDATSEDPTGEPTDDATDEATDEPSEGATDEPTEGATDDADGEDSASSDEPGPGVTPAEAKKAVKSTLTWARRTQSNDPSTAEEARQRAFDGRLRRARAAEYGLVQMTGKEPTVTYKVGEEPTILAVSRKHGGQVFIVAQTEPSPGAPVMHILRSNKGSKRFHIVNQVRMAPGTGIQQFAAPGKGSAMVSVHWSGKRVGAPVPLLKELAESLAFPRESGKETTLRSRSLVPQLREAARKQSEAVSAQATYTQEHKLVPGTTRAIEYDNGSVLAWGMLRRNDVFDVKDGSYLTPPPEFKAFKDTDRINDSATMVTDEFFVLHIPVTGTPSVIGMDEVMVSARGE